MTHHLFCLPGDDYMLDSLDDVVEIRCVKEGDYTVEEWSTFPPSHHLPSADRLLEWVIEYGSENETDEGWWECAEDAILAPHVVGLAENLLAAIDHRITYRMAESLVATHAVHVTVDGFDVETP